MKQEEKISLKHMLTDCAGLLVVLALAALYVVLSVYLSEDIGRLINIIAVIIMALIVSIGFLRWTRKTRNGIIKASKATQELVQATEQIRTMAQNPSANLYDGLANLFTVVELKDAYAEYRRENDRLYRDDDAYCYCDVADYLDDDLLSEIANADYNDLVGNMMTGLGILGTFIGLIIGLANFNNGSTEEMQGKIEKQLRDAGFTNITRIEEEDIKGLGLFVKENTVDYMTINGKHDFKKVESYSSDAIITLYIHSKPQK